MTDQHLAAPFAPAQDRIAPAAWLGLWGVGMVAGFGLDFPRYLQETPPPLPIVHLHALVFSAWVGFVGLQVFAILKGRFADHRKLGLWGLALAGAMLLLGPVTALTTKKRAMLLGHGHPQFLAVNVAAMGGFILLLAAGYAFRKNPAAHKRLMVLSAVSMADTGFSRFSGTFFPDPDTQFPWFIAYFWGNILLILAMGGWDLWRWRRLHPAFVVGATVVLALDWGASILFFNPAWAALTTSWVKAWSYAG